MPAPAASSPAAVRRDADALVFSGALRRAAVSGLWKDAAPSSLDGVRRLDLSGVTAIDSAGLALLAELASLIAAKAGRPATIDGDPAGLAELRAAYRLGETLTFAAA